ncbi:MULTISPECIES: ABC transporter ATP-binding protein [unclassified Devosia]|uniref:ABC transporter ATP-binding protein n=1 Tax=unclassified Devosia TaxID=196773 RepID=UPI00145CCF7D|nr:MULTISPECIES: ABC transporter ATP-binding protein [unclassified Devosia]MBJ6988106.1 ABC transporter ATP-binding protein [Devosia sp. MC521]QMW63392.1 ABC transporter ATP-binding protein [Devosia sp. MC521]
MTYPVLSVRNLNIDYIGADKNFSAVKDVSFDIAPGEFFGLAGESGCGKSTIAFAISRLHRPPALIRKGSEIIVGGRDVLQLNDKELKSFRWREVAMVFQSAMNSLNPVLTIADQFYDVLKTHTKVTRAEARERAAELLKLVDISPDRLDVYPHQCSGGMRQRIVIAICLSLNPKLLIMDEPTTALDVVVQREILQRIDVLRKRLGFSVLFITHDLGLMVQVSDRIGIMLSGEMVECNDSQTIYNSPQHDYTKKLWASMPKLHGEQIRPEASA